MSVTLSLEEIRKCFPALARIHNGYPVAYFDGPGGTQVPRSVVEAMAMGIPVLATNTGGPTMPSWDGYGDWNLPWSTWQTGGVLPTS